MKAYTLLIGTSHRIVADGFGYFTLERSDGYDALNTRRWVCVNPKDEKFSLCDVLSDLGSALERRRKRRRTRKRKDGI